LITTLALREEAQSGSLSLAAFYIRRSFRIFPLYYLTLAVYVFLILVLGIQYDAKGLLLSKALPWYLTYLQEVPAAYGLTDPNGVVRFGDIPFYQSWSLGIEEKFYLVWPLLAFVAWRANARLRFVGTSTVVVVFALLPTALLLADPLAPRLRLDPLAECLEPYYRILAGCWLGVALHNPDWFARLQQLGRPTALYWSLALMVVLHLARPHVPDDSEFFRLIDLQSILYVAAVTLFLACLLLGDGPIQRFLRKPLIALVGRISYGIYLIHVLCLNVVQRIVYYVSEGLAADVVAYVLTCVLSITCAYVLYRLIERPLIDVGRQWSQRVRERQTSAVREPALP
jgi:peptidoglycan/LPS O-acetylase OafA/YrhL